MWGLAGTMLASADAHAITGERRWRDLFEAAAARLLGDLQDSAAGPIWVQDLYGGRKAWLGPVHGYAGNLAPLLRGWAWLTEAQREQVAELMRTVLPATAHRSEAGVTWPGVTPAGPPRLVQHCHGAPGMVTTLAAGPVRSAEWTGCSSTPAGSPGAPGRWPRAAISATARPEMVTPSCAGGRRLSRLAEAGVHFRHDGDPAMPGGEARPGPRTVHLVDRRSRPRPRFGGLPRRRRVLSVR